jgi:hypothetical protein
MDAAVRSPASGETWPDMRRWWGPSWSSRSTGAVAEGAESCYAGLGQLVLQALTMECAACYLLPAGFCIWISEYMKMLVPVRRKSFKKSSSHAASPYCCSLWRFSSGWLVRMFYRPYHAYIFYWFVRQFSWLFP